MAGGDVGEFPSPIVGSKTATLASLVASATLFPSPIVGSKTHKNESLSLNRLLVSVPYSRV